MNYVIKMKSKAGHIVTWEGEAFMFSHALSQARETLFQTWEGYNQEDWQLLDGFIKPEKEVRNG